MLALDVGLILCICLLGVLVVKITLGRAQLLDYLGLALPIGGGLLTWFLFLVSILGIPLTPLVIVVIYAALCTCAAFLAVRRAPGALARAAAAERPIAVGPVILLAGGLLLALGLFSLGLAVGRSYSTYDAAAGWAVKGYGIGLEGSVLAADRWGTWGRAYPLNLSLQIGLFSIFDGDLLPGSKLLFPLQYASLIAGIFQFWRRQGVDSRLAAVGLLFLASNPLVFLHSTLGLANLLFGVYFALGTLWLAEGLVLDEQRFQWMGALLLAIGCWTRAEGIAYTLALVAALGLCTWGFRWGRPRRLTFLLPIALAVGTWFPFSWGGVAGSHLGIAMGGFVDRVLAGQLNARYLMETIRLYVVRGMDSSNLGFLLPSLIFLLGLGLVRFRPSRQPLVAMLLVGSMIAAAMPVLLFYIRSFTRWEDFTELLIRSFDRATLPAIFMIVATAILLFNASWNPRSRASGGSGPLDDRLSIG
jgi:hypothetical protein